MEPAGKNSENSQTLQSTEEYQPRLYPSKYNLIIPGPNLFNRTAEDNILHCFVKNGDEKENGASSTNELKKIKKKHSKTERNVVVTSAIDVVGHRSDIINDIDKLNEYICGTTPKTNNHKSNPHKHVQGGTLNDRRKKQHK